MVYISCEIQMQLFWRHIGTFRDKLRSLLSPWSSLSPSVKWGKCQKFLTTTVTHRLDNVYEVLSILPVSCLLLYVISCCFLPDMLCFSNTELFMVPLSHTMLLYAYSHCFFCLCCLYKFFSAFIAPTLCSPFTSADISFKKPLLLFPAPPPMWISCLFQLMHRSLLCHSIHIIFLSLYQDTYYEITNILVSPTC